MHVRAGEPPVPSSLAATWAKLADADLADERVGEALSSAAVVPVITAHPTETRRRTVFEVQRRITDLMRYRDRTELTPDEDTEVTAALRRQILTLWQTALIRLERLRIEDEIEVGLRYYDASFFEVIPSLNASLRDHLREQYPAAGLPDTPIVRMGSWIGGDRDGNPFVTGDVVALATGRAARTALDHHLTELTLLAQELSMSSRLVTVSDAVVELGGADSGDVAADEPYRLALRHIRSRLLATVHDRFGDDAGAPGHSTTPARPPMVPRRNCSPTSTSSTSRCGPTVTGHSPTTGCCDCGSPCARSGSTCRVSTCGRTPTSTRRSWPSCSHGPACMTTTRR